MVKILENHPADGSFGGDLKALNSKTSICITVRVSLETYRALELGADARDIPRGWYSRLLIEDALRRSSVIPENYREDWNDSDEVPIKKKSKSKKRRSKNEP
jgi:hypothetical protein